MSRPDTGSAGALTKEAVMQEAQERVYRDSDDDRTGDVIGFGEWICDRLATGAGSLTDEQTLARAAELLDTQGLSPARDYAADNIRKLIAAPTVVPDHLKGHTSLAEMVSTHIGVFREALSHMLTNEAYDRAYVEHELKALADIDAACKTELASAESLRKAAPADERATMKGCAGCTDEAECAWNQQCARASASPAAEGHHYSAKDVGSGCANCGCALTDHDGGRTCPSSAPQPAHEIVAEQKRTHEFVQFADRTRFVASIDPNDGVSAVRATKGAADETA
ncbi:TPA: hypothetical protein QDB10_002167 [Burkholderia vietnamiensis]|nr:hypothetical protein [Burkholderia vietnamiensis]